MRSDVFVTSIVLSVAPVLHKRQYGNAPSACYAVYNNATTIAENTGYVADTLCVADSPFMNALDACYACTAANAANATTLDAFPELQKYAEFCALNGAPDATSTSVAPSALSSYNANSAAIALSVSSAASVASVYGIMGSSVSWCSRHYSVYTKQASNCSTFQDATAPASTSSPTTSPSGTVKHASHSHLGAIVGGVVGGVSGLAVVLIIGWLAYKRRQKSPVALREDVTVHEKAQLHSNDLQPDWKELLGSPAPNALLEKKAIDISELPANEPVIDKDRLKEMPSNEPAGHEMETTENEMAALDRMVRMTDSTTLGSSHTKSDGQSVS